MKQAHAKRPRIRSLAYLMQEINFARYPGTILAPGASNEMQNEMVLARGRLGSTRVYIKIIDCNRLETMK